MTTELNVSKYMDVTVHSDSIVVRDKQHGDVAIGATVFERLMIEYLKENNDSSFVEVKE
jgi:hypothetical protein